MGNALDGRGRGQSLLGGRQVQAGGGAIDRGLRHGEMKIGDERVGESLGAAEACCYPRSRPQRRASLGSESRQERMRRKA